MKWRSRSCGCIGSERSEVLADFILPVVGWGVIIIGMKMVLYGILFILVDEALSISLTQGVAFIELGSGTLEKYYIVGVRDGSL